MDLFILAVSLLLPVAYGAILLTPLAIDTHRYQNTQKIKQ